MVKHTPGPWAEGDLYGALKREVLNTEGNRLIATVQVRYFDGETGFPVDWPEGEANLRAILLVPELVEALGMAVEAIGNSDAEFCRKAARRAHDLLGRLGL